MSASPFEAEFAHLGDVVRKLEHAGHKTEAAVEQAIGYAAEHLKSLLPAKPPEAAAVVAAPVATTPAAVVTPAASAQPQAE